MLLDKVSIHSWIINNGIKTESGQVLDFHDHRYLFDIYRDNSPFLCCLKAGQIGFSTMAILKTIWLSRNYGINVGYILPTVEMVQKFVGSKVNGLARENPIISSWMKDKDSITLKQIDKYFIHYLGAQTDRSAIMLSLDMLVADEYDKAPQEILEIYDSRLQHSKFGYKWVFSNPTIPDFGVDRFWQMSDKKKWHIKHSCKEIYILDESCIDYEKEIYRCPKCKQEISDDNRRMGEWIATDEGKWSGYWIPLWVNPMIPASKICEYKRTKTAEYFQNFVAGLPYINSTNMLTQRILESNLVNKVNSQDGRIIIGVDTGHDIHYTMGNKEGRFFYGHIPSVAQNPTPNYNPWDEIEKLLIRFPRSIAIIDQGGDLIGPRILQKKYPGRVYLCWFVKPTKNQELIRWVDEENGIGVCKVLVDRNRMIQESVEEYKEQRSPIQGNKETWQPWFDHALNIYRVKETVGEEDDPQYGWRYVWKRKGPDHFFLSDIYFRVGLDRFANDLATIVHTNSVLTGVPRAFNGSITTPDLNELGFIENI
jgi:hypothetical protein